MSNKYFLTFKDYILKNILPRSLLFFGIMYITFRYASPHIFILGLYVALQLDMELREYLVKKFGKPISQNEKNI